MVHWPKSIYGNSLLFLIALGVASLLVSFITLVGPWVWPLFAVAGVTGVALFALRRRVEMARERAWDGSFSVANAVARTRADQPAPIAAPPA